MRFLIAFLVGSLVAGVGVKNRDQLQELARRVTSRGIRNNNPGNIRISRFDWRGKVPIIQNTDGEFEQFVEPRWGIRAIARDLKTKSRRGLRSIRDIITAYAPPSENDTEAYIRSVSRQTDLDPNAQLNVDAELFDLVDAIMVHENGGHDYPDPLIREAIALA